MKTKGISYLVVGILGVFALGGLYATYDLVRAKVDAGAVAVVAGLTGTALGAVGGVLAQTQANQQKDDEAR